MQRRQPAGEPAACFTRVESTGLRLAIVTAAVVVAAAHAVAGPVVGHLRCEHRTDPEGIDAPRPRLAWIIDSESPGERQTAYQVVAATTAERLARDEGDLWDSDRVESADSAGIPYGGRELASHDACFWKVRIWGRGGVPTAWSEPARWSMGLLDADDWRATWIGLDAEIPKRFVQDTNWIWHPDDGPVEALPGGKRFFRRSFEIPADRPIANVVLRITADDACTIFLDGREIGTRSGGQATKEMDLTYRMRPGRHVLAVMAENKKASGPAGLIARLHVDFATGEQLVVRADDSWKATAEESPGWQQPDFDDSAWRPARVLGPVGMPPWGPVRRAEERRRAARYLRREFDVTKPVRRAVVSVCGLGLSELHLNGRKVGDHVLSPALAEYPKRLWYVTHDVTGQVKQGRNALGAILGNGRFFAVRSQVYASMPTYGLPMLLLHLRVEHDDGSVTTLVSDEAWRATDAGPILANNEYDGEEYDARRSLDEWASAGYSAASWRPVDRMPSPTGMLTAQMIEPIRVVERIPPRSVARLPSGAAVFDFGQNIVGWCRLRVSGSSGTRITLRHAERLLPDGGLDLANLRGARATDVYTLAGLGTEIWQPRFTYHGFRYVEVAGLPGEPTLDALEGCVVHDDLRPTGRIRTSSEVLNTVARNAVWGLRGNYRSVPTDCPQRDERQAWLGDRLQVPRGEAYVFDTAAFYDKWLTDIADAQRDDGAIPDVCPAHWPSFTDNVVWPSAAILVAEGQWRHFGDRRIVERHYPCFARWIEHMLEYVKDGITDRDTYGDWCVPPEDPRLIHSQDPARKTAPALLATSFLAHDLAVMAGFADLLGRGDDAERFRREASAVRVAFNRRFFDPERASYDNGTQTSCVLPLAFGLVPEGESPRVARRLVERIEAAGGHIATGLVGGQFLHRTLTAAGQQDLAFAIASSRDYPSLGFMADRGATTVWELWNGDTADPAMNSGNHVMLTGDLLEWMYADLAGIAPGSNGGGFRTIRMAPRFVKGLDFLDASYDSPFGRIESRWRRVDAGIRWEVTVPVNAVAEVVVPAGLRLRSPDPDNLGPEAAQQPLMRLPSGRHTLELE
jgi:alpha-L-rhamnosidase